MLTPLDVQIGRVLAIVAHPDDLEYGPSAAVAAWTAAGQEVTYCLATHGEAGIDGIDPVECAPLRRREQQASAEVVGVSTVDFLQHPDGVVQQSLQLRRDFATVIRRRRPDTLLLVNYRETWASGTMNSPDHRNVGQAAIDAVGDAANRWVFPELLRYAGLQPWSVQHVLVANSPRATYGLDVSATVDVAVSALKEHRFYLAGLGDHPMADPEYLRAVLETDGQHLSGASAAVPFELVKV